MTATSHAVIGVAIAATFSNPIVAIPAAIASHALADMVPHWDTATHRHEKSKKELWVHSAIDGIISIITVYILTTRLFPQTSLLYAYIIVFFSLLLDLLTAPYIFLDIKNKFFIYIYKFQKKFDRKLDKPWGIVSQAVIVILVILLAKAIY